MIILFSGPAAVGKTTICDRLVKEHHFLPIKSSSYLKEIANADGFSFSREILQNIGDRLDVETDYKWLIDSVAKPQLAQKLNHERWYVDSVRKSEQVTLFKNEYKNTIAHIHINASETVIRKRFETRKLANKNNQYEKEYDQHILHPNEISSRNLIKIADFVVDFTSISAAEACLEIFNFMEKR